LLAATDQDIILAREVSFAPDMDEATKQNLGFPAVGIGLLSIVIAGYAWLEGGEWPGITDSWTAILAGIGAVVAILGLLLTWPRG